MEVLLTSRLNALFRVRQAVGALLFDVSSPGLRSVSFTLAHRRQVTTVHLQCDWP